MDNDLTLCQFVNNSSNYVQMTQIDLFRKLQFGIITNCSKYSLFFNVIVACNFIKSGARDINARFEFRNIGIVRLSEFRFIGCFENIMVSIGQFQLED